MNVALNPEKPITEPLATFKFYDSKKRRLSIFGRVIEDNKLEITVLTTSRTVDQKTINTKEGHGLVLMLDVFSKKGGRAKYQEILDGTWHKGKKPRKNDKQPGQQFIVDVIDNRPRYTFLSWCNSRYYRPQTEEKVVTLTTYVRGSNYVHKKKIEKNDESEVKEIA